MDRFKARPPKYIWQIGAAGATFGIRGRAKWLPSVKLFSIFILLAVAFASGSAAQNANIHYGPDTEQVLDLYLPPYTKSAHPFLVFFHGGAFVGGDKVPCAPRLVAELLKKRIGVACANYRLAPRVTFPAPMLDGARAVQWLKAHAVDYNLDPDKVAVMGMSAGAGIAQWIAFHSDLANPSASDLVLRQSTRVSAVVTVNAQATYDPSVIIAEFHTRHLPMFLVPLFGASSMQDLAGPNFSSLEHDASPISHMHVGEPPLLSYYTSDRGVPLSPDSWPEEYLHHPAQGALIERVAKANGAAAIVQSSRSYRGGWEGFLNEAVAYLQFVFVTN